MSSVQYVHRVPNSLHGSDWPQTEPGGGGFQPNQIQQETIYGGGFLRGGHRQALATEAVR